VLFLAPLQNETHVQESLNRGLPSFYPKEYLAR
jgi:hypothetical protein